MARIHRRAAPAAPAAAAMHASSSSSSAAAAAEKRRGSSRPSRLASPSRSSSSNANANAITNSSSQLPTMPPRAAIPSTAAAAPDEPEPSSKSSSSNHNSHVHTHHHNHGGNNNHDRSRSSSNSNSNQHQNELETCLLLRHKDERIAHLESELATMEAEFTRQLDKLSQNESETATFWENKHSALNQQFLRTDTELRVLRAETDQRDALRAQLARAEDEARALRSQVRDLKTFVSTSTRAEGQTSDDVFAREMARLGNGLQNWVISNFRRVKSVDCKHLDHDVLHHLRELVPMYEQLSSAAAVAKIHLLQALVSKMLVDLVFGAYFPGLTDEQTQQFRDMEALLGTLSSPEAVNQWRAFTLALLRRTTTTTTTHHQSSHSLGDDEMHSHVETIVSRIRHLLDAITTSSSSPVTANRSGSTSSGGGSDTSALRTLVINTIDLSRLLAAQKAVLRVHMPHILPHQQVLFDRDTMEDVGGEDEDALAARETDVWCVVFPGLIKYGDENGGQLQFRNVIAKARVLCSPED
ncbi:hypothetical protein AAL_05042 [Moelleriella libera RCEF 2490]|uniref:Involucrin repeat protein n=1 Tax=Moelleriella libera RCEF 2490 TaxID=1081109 RepID=A0A168B830_9HYPO|nr:hypothetical protein AAL_05042 [Moelleriella libera RCEF 2490]